LLIIEKGSPMHRRLLALLASLSLALAFAPALPGSAKTRTPAKVRNDYNAYLKDHLKLEPRLRGARIMAEKTQIPASLIERKQREQAQAAAAAEPCDSTDKPIGCQATFWVHSFKANQDYQSVFILAAKAAHSYIWVDAAAYDPTGATTPDPNGTVTPDEAQIGADRFEKIWETDRAYFGHEANPKEKPYRTPPRLPDNWRDADGDEHINIVNFPMDTGASYVAGYYSSSDEYPVEINEHSNQGEFFYMNSLMLDVGGDSYVGVLAHEFYHMIQFANDSNEETWINEGMADIAIEVNGIGAAAQGHLSEFFNTPEGDQLNHWGGAVLDYGTAYSFLTYLFEHYGGPDDPSTAFHENYTMAEAITKVAEDGFDGLDVVLKGNPQKQRIASYYRTKTVDDVYLDWTVANYLDDPTIEAGQYGYRSIDMKLKAVETFTEFPADTGPQTITPYTNRYYAMSSAGDGSGAYTASPGVLIVDNLDGMPSAPWHYWGNRSDETTTTMTRAADLRGTSAPAMKFSYWYDIETDWDYAFLEVSSDDGKSWSPIVCCEGSRTNPNGNNDYATEGAGMTGQSGVNAVLEQLYYNDPVGLDLRDVLGKPTWVAETVDLSDYAGKQVQIRFRYQTDPAVTFPGFTVDDISLSDGSKTIWANDTATAVQSPWKLEGTAATFLRIAPTIANRLQPQIIKQGARTVVTRPKASRAGDSLKAGGSVDALEGVLVISSLSRISSEVFPYSVTATASPATGITAPVVKQPPAEVSQPFSLSWQAASSAGKRQPVGYLIEESAFLLSDDAESGLGKWETAATELALGWDSSNQAAHSGSSSFYTRSVDGAASQEATLTSKDGLAVPATGHSGISFWSWFSNEGDDAGYVEASVDGQTWKTLTTVVRAVSAPDWVTDAAAPELTEVTASLDNFAGKTVRLRFRYTTGADNRPSTTANGWYVDDIRVTGPNWVEIGRAAGTSFTVAGRPGGTNTYRVGALYTDTMLGPWSNEATAKVKPASSVGGTKTTSGKPAPGGQLPATGVGSSGLFGLIAIAASAVTAAWTRRRRLA
jgi:immune inhibitor A